MSRLASFDQGVVRRLRSVFGHDRLVGGRQAADRSALEPAPGALVEPEDAGEVAFALQTARAEGLGLVVCGEASRMGAGALPGLSAGGYLALGTSRLRGVDELEADSLWLAARAGTRLSEVVDAAAGVGCRPVGIDADDSGTVGGWLATRTQIPDDILGIPQPAALSVEAVLPGGAVVRSVRTPRTANGPDLFSVLLGSRGVFGVITAAALKLEPLPERRLTAGFRFDSLKRSFAFVRFALGGVVVPRGVQLLIDGRRGRRAARVWLAVEGRADLAAAAMRALQTEARRCGGKLRDPERVRAWRQAAAFGSRRPFEASTRWSELSGLLRGADRLMGGFALAVLDRPCPTGCRVRLAPGEDAEGTFRPGWERLVDPDGSRAAAIESARGIAGRIRAELDPLGLLNPWAWPLNWPVGEG